MHAQLHLKPAAATFWSRKYPPGVLYVLHDKIEGVVDDGLVSSGAKNEMRLEAFAPSSGALTIVHTNNDQRTCHLEAPGL